MEWSRILGGKRLLPIVTIGDAADAVPLMEALRRGGLSAIEITLRTPAAADAMRAIKAADPDFCVGAGTIRSEADIAKALDAGADFLVSPGTTSALAQALKESGLPCLPGAATASEAMARFEEGFEALKFFPAEQAGGIAALQALAGPLPDVRFCPTGGVTQARAPDYLALNTVFCVGGSWVASEALLAAKDWAAIEANARAAAAL